MRLWRHGLATDQLAAEKDMEGVLVCHPGLQHSHKLAEALYEGGLLKRFVSGVPLLNHGLATTSSSLPEWLQMRLKRTTIPGYLRTHWLSFPLAGRLAARTPYLFDRSGPWSALDRAFDRRCVKLVHRLRPDAVVCYENAGVHTFQAAKKIGALCILDAASLHYAMALKLNPESSRHLKTEDRKNAEIQLADHILVCSSVAAESYAAAGVPERKLHIHPLGAELLAPFTGLSINTQQDVPRFIFAGALRYLKAIDVILEAFARVHAKGGQYRLDFVGSEAEAGWAGKISQVPHTTYTPHVNQYALQSMMANADCLLLPSRYDSFGMVVLEAMAVGTPAIVSSTTGAKDVIDAFPQSGWIVDCNVESLFECIWNRLARPNELLEARIVARRAASAFGWADYKHGIQSQFLSWLGGCNV